MKHVNSVAIRLFAGFLSIVFIAIVASPNSSRAGPLGVAGQTITIVREPTLAPRRPVVTTNVPQYAPGDLVGITGHHFTPNSVVTLQVMHLAGACASSSAHHQPWTVTANSSGDISAIWKVDEPSSPDAIFLVIAVNVNGTQVASSFLASLSGEFFKSDQCGNPVNGNHYDTCQPSNPLACDSPKAPFIYGGSTNCSSGSSLPDGDYYFQVTGPGIGNNPTLDSTDGIECRQIHVSGGFITAYGNIGGCTTHVTHDGPCAGTKTVALWPFAQSNPGGVHKVWITRVADYDPSNGNYAFGFNKQLSKIIQYKCAGTVGTGACCGACPANPNIFFDECVADSTAEDCATMGGDYQGDDSVCPGATCGDCSKPCLAACPPDVSVECGADTSPGGSIGSGSCVGTDCLATHSDSFAAGCGITGVITRTWTCDNGEDEPTSCTQHINIVNTIGPVITLIDPASISLECGIDSYVEPGASVADACDSSLISVVIGGDTVNTHVPGEYHITYDATDACGHAATQVVRTVTVVDTIPPVVTVSEPIELWPPNHKYHTFTLSDCVVSAIDACQGVISPNGSGNIVSIYSDEPENTIGDGNTSNDIVIVNNRTFKVRSERMGGEDGRVYGVNFTITDDHGNTTTSTCHLTVPHDQSGAPAVDDGPAAGYTVYP